MLSDISLNCAELCEPGSALHLQITAYDLQSRVYVEYHHQSIEDAYLNV